MTASDKPAARAGKSKPLPEHLKAYRGVWVVVETERGRVHPVSWELMGQARLLADQLGVEVAAVLIGPNEAMLADAAADAFLYGADLAHLVASPVLGPERCTLITTQGTSPITAKPRFSCISEKPGPLVAVNDLAPARDAPTMAAMLAISSSICI